MTVRFQSLHETEWVRRALHAPRLRRIQSLSPILLYAALSGFLPSTLLGKADPESHPPRAAGLFRLTGFLGPRHFGGAPPPLLALLQEAELSLGLAVGGGAEGSVSPHPTPSSGFLLETDCAASSSHHCHRPSHHHACLFPWAWLSLPAKIPLYPLVLGPTLGVEGRLGRDFKSNDPDALSGMAVLGPVEGLLEPAERTSKRKR